MTFNVDKTALRNSLWSRGTGSAWGQRGRTLHQGNLLGLNISKSKINPSPFPLEGWEETAHPGNAGGCIPERVLGNIILDSLVMANQTRLQQKGSPWMDPAALSRQQQIRGKKIGATEVTGAGGTGAGTWRGLAALSAFPLRNLLRHLDDWGSVGNSPHNIPGWIWDSIGLLNLVCQPRTICTWCFLLWVERGMWEAVGLMSAKLDPGKHFQCVSSTGMVGKSSLGHWTPASMRWDVQQRMDMAPLYHSGVMNYQWCKELSVVCVQHRQKQVGFSGLGNPSAAAQTSPNLLAKVGSKAL